MSMMEAQGNAPRIFPTQEMAVRFSTLTLDKFFAAYSDEKEMALAMAEEGWGKTCWYGSKKAPE